MRDAAEQAGSSTVIEQAAKATQANLRATSEVEIASIVSSLVTYDSDLSSSETPAGGIGRARQRTLLLRVMERAHAQAALVFVAAEDGQPQLIGSAGEPQPQLPLCQALMPLLACEPDELTELDPPPLQVAGVTYDVLYLPRVRQLERRVVMLLVRERRTEDELPATMLARLAQRVQSELSIHDDVEDSMPVSDVPEPLGWPVLPAPASSCCSGAYCLGAACSLAAPA
jgi:hypothetical protein